MSHVVRSRTATVLTALVATLTGTALVGCSGGGGQAAGSAGNACVSGTLTYTFDDAEHGGTAGTHPVRNATWELRGASAPGGSAGVLASGTTSGTDGTFRACAAASALSGGSLRFTSENNALWRVIRNVGAAPYTFTTPIGDGSATDQDLGTIAVPAAIAGAWRITDTLNDLYAQRATTSPCWTSRQTTLDMCHELTFVWAPDRTDGGYFDVDASNAVILAGADPKSAHLILHEAGHWLMWQLYGEWFPDVTQCDPHYVDEPSSVSCAWTEGFADAVAAHALGDRRFVSATGDETLLDGAAGKGGSPWPGGDQTQGNVGSALLDLWALDGGWEQSIALMTHVRSNDFHDYITVARPKDGLASDGAALDALTGHGITY